VDDHAVNSAVPASTMALASLNELVAEVLNHMSIMFPVEDHPRWLGEIGDHFGSSGNTSTI
jgi:hypothetical protein